ncbi:MAG: carbonic anhydrase family protein [Rickettsiales bacterium]
MNKFVTIAIGTILCSAPVLAGEGADWGYSGDKSPEKWGSIKQDYSVCDTGKLQSPFDVKATFKAADLPDIKVSYKSMPLSLSSGENGLTIQAAAGNKITVGDDVYELLQFHFHTPSEYKVNGKSYPMEMHLVHKRVSDGALGVFAVMVAKGAENSHIKTIWDNIPEKGSKAEPKDVSINLADLLPKSMKYTRFMGSLTTPPCSEGVNWHMLSAPITVSDSQIAKFTSIYGNNARPIQPANDRLVVSE